MTVRLATAAASRRSNSDSKNVAFLGSLLLFSLFLLCRPAFSQVNLGRILGGVTDQSGGAMVGAKVTVVDVARGITRSLITDGAGEYAVPSLTPSTYTVKVEANGFSTIQRTDIVVGVGQDVRVDFTLTPGVQTQSITVSAAIQEINTTNAQLGGTLQTQPLNDLPVNGRSYTKLVTFLPGVVVAPGGYSYTFHSNGNRQESQVWLLDGLDDSSPWAGAGPTVGGAALQGDEATVLPMDSIQEVNIIENPTAEYGWKPGAQVNVGLKSGTNSIHGTAYAFGRNSAFDARNPFLPPSLGKAEDDLEQFGASIGGPIKRNKIFYFGNYEGQRFTVGNPKTVQNPSSLSGAGAGSSFPDAITDMKSHGITPSQLSLNLAGCTSAAVCNPTSGVFNNGVVSSTVPTALNNVGKSDAAIEKIDYHLSDRNSFNGEYYFGQGNQNAVSNALHEYWAQANLYRSQVIRGVWIFVPNSDWVNEARFGYDRANLPSGPAECTQNLGQPVYASAFGFISGAPTAPPECGFPTLTISGFQGLGQAASTEILVGTWSASDVVSYTRGKHLIKFGANWENSRFYGPGKVTNLTGSLSFGAVSAFSGATALEDFLAGVPASGTILLGNAIRHFRQPRYALFIQDDFRLKPRFTVSMGLRYEIEPPLTDTNHELGNFDPSAPTGLVQETGGQDVYNTYRHFSPHLGFNWDLTGKGTTVIRAGANIMSNTLPANALVQSPNGAQLNAIPTGFKLVAANGAVLPSPGNIQVGNVSLTGSQLNWGLNTPVFNSTPSALACGNGLGGNPAPCAISPINPKLTGSYVNAWTLGVQHAFVGNLLLDVAYIGTHGTKLGGSVDINQPTPGALNTSSSPGNEAEQLRRPYYSQFPYLGQMRYYTNLMESNYNGLQVTLTERASHGVTFAAGYTYAHYLDEQLNEVASMVMNNSKPGLEYGDSPLDARHNFTFTGTYHIPGGGSHKQLLGGWELNAAVNLMSALPYNAMDSTSDISGTGELFDRWTIAGPASAFKGGHRSVLPCYGTSGSSFAKSDCAGSLPAACVSAAAAEPNGISDSSLPVGATLPWGGTNVVTTGTQSLMKLGCYMEGNSVIVPPAQGTYGNMGRNVLRAVPYYGWDSSVTKSWKYRELLTAEARLEVFNVINVTSYASPSANPSVASSFGQSQSTPNTGNVIIGSGGPRQLQIGLKFIF
jgi:hypothetical protein